MRNVFTDVEPPTYAHWDGRDAVFVVQWRSTSVVTGFAPMVCFVCLFFYHKPILNILIGRISMTVEKYSGYWPLLWSRVKGFSITFEESISYLRYNYDSLASISFYRITHWLTHFGVNHALHTKLYEIQFSIFDVQTSLWYLCICVYGYIWPQHCIYAWLVRHIFYGRTHLPLLFAQ